MPRTNNLHNLSFVLTEEIKKEFPEGTIKTKNIGKKAMKYISDLPLYANISNITYQEAIGIALLLGFSWEKK